MKPVVIDGTNLSNAWREVVHHVVQSSGKEIRPLLISLTGFEESEQLRQALDANLKKHKLGSIQTVSETIFPNSLYRYNDYNRFALYNEYLSILPRIKMIDKRNRKGTYFERLIAYDAGEKKINQLEIIIASLKNKNVKRRSKLQASIFDPRMDHTKGMFQGFPCLQHVSFFRSENGGLVLNSFYAIQYLYQRAYGNWLGLINLGKFISRELDIEFEQFNCYVGVEQLDKLTKKQAQKLLEKVKKF